MSTHIKYASLRHNTWVYRRVYPKQLQPLLGFALKQSLKTSDARIAKQRVAELNATYASIVEKAQAHATTLSYPNTDTSAVLDVAPPRYQRLSLMGRRALGELGSLYLSEQSDRLRYGSYKSVRYAIGLLTSHLGVLPLGDITRDHGVELLSLIAQLSPNIRKYAAAKGKGLTELASLSLELEGTVLTPQTQARIWEQMSAFLEWCVRQGELRENPWTKLRVSSPPVPEPHRVLTGPQVVTLLAANDRVLHGALLFGLLSGLRSGEIVGLMVEDITHKGNLGRFVSIRPNSVRLLKSKAAEREVPLHGEIERYLDAVPIPPSGRLFPALTVDKVVKRYAKLRRKHPGLLGTVFHSTRKWFVTQCERTGTPEHFTASLVGHQSARSANRLTYGLYSDGISDAQKRDIIDRIRRPEGGQP
jgi:integrase